MDKIIRGIDAIIKKLIINVTKKIKRDKLSEFPPLAKVMQYATVVRR